jgi:hypothetical protein
MPDVESDVDGEPDGELDARVESAWGAGRERTGGG